MKKNFFPLAITVFIIFLSGCGSSSQKKEEAAQTQISPSSDNLPQPAPIAGDKVYTLSPGKTSIKWHGMKKLIDSHHYGTVMLKNGEVAVTNGALSAGKFVVDMTTIHSTDLEGNPKYADLVGHLKSEDFFDVANYPEATLEITSVEPLQGNEEANATVYANLTIKGITHNISFPAQITVSDTQVSARGKFTIDRSKWNVRYGSESFFKNLGDKVIKNEIDFEVNFTADVKLSS
jgi:polyisoprenoid-binding protein YceI